MQNRLLGALPEQWENHNRCGRSASAWCTRQDSSLHLLIHRLWVRVPRGHQCLGLSFQCSERDSATHLAAPYSFRPYSHLCKAMIEFFTVRLALHLFRPSPVLGRVITCNHQLITHDFPHACKDSHCQVHLILNTHTRAAPQVLGFENSRKALSQLLATNPDRLNYR